MWSISWTFYNILLLLCIWCSALLLNLTRCEISFKDSMDSAESVHWRKFIYSAEMMSIFSYWCWIDITNTQNLLCHVDIGMSAAHETNRFENLLNSYSKKKKNDWKTAIKWQIQSILYDYFVQQILASMLALAIFCSHVLSTKIMMLFSHEKKGQITTNYMISAFCYKKKTLTWNLIDFHTYAIRWKTGFYSLCVISHTLVFIDHLNGFWIIKRAHHTIRSMAGVFFSLFLHWMNVAISLRNLLKLLVIIVRINWYCELNSPHRFQLSDIIIETL